MFVPSAMTCPSCGASSSPQQWAQSTGDPFACRKVCPDCGAEHDERDIPHRLRHVVVTMPRNRRNWRELASLRLRSSHDARAGEVVELKPVPRVSPARAGDRGYDVKAAAVAKCAGVSPDNRKNWAKPTSKRPALLRAGPGFTALDAVETAVFAKLTSVNQKLAADAWLALRTEVHELVLAGHDELWIMMSATGFGHRVAASASAAATRGAEDVAQAFHVVRTGRAIPVARKNFDALAAKLVPAQIRTATVSSIPRKRGR
jgi:hypothetical protein